MKTGNNMNYTDIELLEGLSRYGYVDGTDIPVLGFQDSRIQEIRSIIRSFIKPGRVFDSEIKSGYITESVNRLCRADDFWGSGDYSDGEVIKAFVKEGYKGRRVKNYVIFGLNKDGIAKLRSKANQIERAKRN